MEILNNVLKKNQMCTHYRLFMYNGRSGTRLVCGQLY